MSVQAVGEPAVTGVSPTSGPVAGATSVTISGSLFTGVTAVSFGTTPAASYTFVSDTQIDAVSPPGTAGPVDVIVTNAVGPSIVNSADLFTYVAPPPAPAVSSVTPNSGPLAGGTPVTIGGSAFTGATAVSFGAAAASFTVTNDSQIAATSPAGTGVVDVRVTTPAGGTSAIVAADHFTYAAGPTVGSVSPTYGSPSGGTTVTIIGANLTGASAVHFGVNAATGVTVVSATQVTAISPAGTGQVDVTVTTPGGTGTLSLAFNYWPTVTSVVPSGGPTAGGTPVTITGTNFTTATVVSFGTATASFARVSDSQITTTSPPTNPPNTAGPVDVRVTNPGGPSVVNPTDTFTYALAPTITAPLSPNIGGVLGFTPVTIFGSGLTGAAVYFGAFPAGFQLVQQTDSQLKVISPGGSGTVDVKVVALGGTITLKAAFTYTTRCLSAGLTANPPAAPAGATIVFMASSTGCPFPRYEFWLGYPNGTWHLRQYWGISITWTWDSRGLPAGNYGVRLGANNAGDPLTSFEARGQLSYALSGCASATLTATLGSPQVVGAVETLTATSTGCSNPRYEYWLGYPSGAWVLVRAFSSSPTWTWYTAGYPPGNYTIHVWANEFGNSTASYEAFGEITPYNLSVLASCATASLLPPSLSQSAGTMVTLTASSTTCPNPTYEFWVQYPPTNGSTNGTWYLRQGWGGATFNWDTTFLAPGTYNVHVWANQAFHSTATWEAYGSDTVTLTGCSSAALSPATVSQSAGAPINFTASSMGCNPVYEFWVGYPNGSWVLKQGWGGAAFSWSTAGLSPGMYSIHAWANQQGASQATWEAYGTASVSLSTCASASLAPASVTKAVGSLVAFTAGSTGCLSPQFEYWVQYPSGTWYLKRPFLTDPTWSWNTTGLAKGTYTVHVWANNAGDSQAAWEAYGTSTVTLN